MKYGYKRFQKDIRDRLNCNRLTISTCIQSCVCHMLFSVVFMCCVCFRILCKTVICKCIKLKHICVVHTSSLLWIHVNKMGQALAFLFCSGPRTSNHMRDVPITSICFQFSLRTHSICPCAFKKPKAKLSR